MPIPRRILVARIFRALAILFAGLALAGGALFRTLQGAGVFSPSDRLGGKVASVPALGFIVGVVVALWGVLELKHRVWGPVEDPPLPRPGYGPPPLGAPPQTPRRRGERRSSPGRAISAADDR